MFLSEQAWWIEDYALFRAIHVHEGERPWTEWPEALQRREPSAIDHARRELSREVLFHQYLQWLAGVQWQQARSNLHGVQLFGDLPFMVDADSADVWARQDQFRLDLSLGAPPDAFSATGQDWGMPVYRWDVIAAQDFRWLRERARRSADLFDGYRIDHLVGFYRTYGRPRDGAEPFFSPAVQREQEALGERVLGIFPIGRLGDHRRRSRHGSRFRPRLARAPGRSRIPRAALGAALARGGTAVPRPRRLSRRVGRRVRHARHRADDHLVGSCLGRRAPEGERDPDGAAHERRRPASWTPATPRVRDVLLETLFASKSDLLLLPMQDVFGWRDRINEPATVTDANWTFRLPWPVDRLDDVPEARERQATLRHWST